MCVVRGVPPWGIRFFLFPSEFRLQESSVQPRELTRTLFLPPVFQGPTLPGPGDFWRVARRVAQMQLGPQGQK